MREKIPSRGSCAKIELAPSHSCITVLGISLRTDAVFCRFCNACISLLRKLLSLSKSFGVFCWVFFVWFFLGGWFFAASVCRLFLFLSCLWCSVHELAFLRMLLLFLYYWWLFRIENCPLYMSYIFDVLFYFVDNVVRYLISVLFPVFLYRMLFPLCTFFFCSFYSVKKKMSSYIVHFYAISVIM